VCLFGCSLRPLPLPEAPGDLAPFGCGVALADLAVVRRSNLPAEAPPTECDARSEDSCSQGCTAMYCPDCVGGRRFSACRAPSGTNGFCPDVCERGGCRENGDCPNVDWCLAPGEVSCPVQCRPGCCSSDRDCPGALVCEKDPCSCSLTSCRLGCSITGCPDGQSCAADNHCVPISCGADGECPTLFVCDGGACRRRPCRDDYACQGGYCVKGGCLPTLGQCSGPRPGT
jgi:hypothetical protein